MLTDLSADFTGKCILIVEDEALVALEIAAVVTAAGGTVLGPASTIAAAMALIDANQSIEGAILDIRLKDGISAEVAKALKGKGVPLISVTGYDDWYIPSDLEDVPVYRKPSDPANVVRLLFENAHSKDP